MNVWQGSSSNMANLIMHNSIGKIYLSTGNIIIHELLLIDEAFPKEIPQIWKINISKLVQSGGCILLTIFLTEVHNCIYCNRQESVKQNKKHLANILKWLLFHRRKNLFSDYERTTLDLDFLFWWENTYYFYYSFRVCTLKTQGNSFRLIFKLLSILLLTIQLLTDFTAEKKNQKHCSWKKKLIIQKLRKYWLNIKHSINSGLGM